MIRHQEREVQRLKDILLEQTVAEEERKRTVQEISKKGGSFMFQKYVARMGENTPSAASPGKRVMLGIQIGEKLEKGEVEAKKQAIEQGISAGVAGHSPKARNILGHRVFTGFEIAKISKEYIYNPTPYCQYMAAKSTLCHDTLKAVSGMEIKKSDKVRLLDASMLKGSTKEYYIGGFSTSSNKLRKTSADSDLLITSVGSITINAEAKVGSH